MPVAPSAHQPLKVALIVPAKKFRCLGSMLWIQRYGPLQVASVTHEAGHFVRLFNEEIGNHLYPEKIARSFDVVGFSAKTSAVTRAEKLAEKIKSEARRLNRQIVTILGGEHASMANGSRAAGMFDYMLPGESEQAFIDILDAIQLQREGLQIRRDTLSKSNLMPGHIELGGGAGRVSDREQFEFLKSYHLDDGRSRLDRLRSPKGSGVTTVYGPDQSSWRENQ